jgi:uncharacterized protein YdcH (DUF465 family)
MTIEQGGIMSPKRIHSLLIKSAEIQQEIEREHARPRPDTFRLLKLKKLRLAIKDRIITMLRAARNSGKKLKRRQLISI